MKFQALFGNAIFHSPRYPNYRTKLPLVIELFFIMLSSTLILIFFHNETRQVCLQRSPRPPCFDCLRAGRDVTIETVTL